MFEDQIEPIQVDDPITATWLNKLRKAALAALNLKVEPPLELIKTAGGFVLRIAWNPRIWIKIASGSNPYAWTEQNPAASGTWAAGSKSGTTSLDPAYEQNGNTAVPANVVVLARRAFGTGQWIFQLGACSTSQPASVITPPSPTSGLSGAMAAPPRFLAPPPVSFSGFPDGAPPLTAVIPTPP